MAAPRRTLPALLLLILLLVGAAIGLVLQSDDDEAPPSSRGTTPVPAEEADDGEKVTKVRALVPRERVEPADAPTTGSDSDAPGEDAPIEYEFPPVGKPLMRTVRVVALREDGGPVRDARVTVFTSFGRFVVVPEEGRTDLAGEAVLQLSGAANFRVRAWTRDAAGISEPVSLAPGKDGEVVVRLVAGRAVTGVVTSSEGGGLPGARITLSLATDDPFGLRLIGTAGQDGAFDLGVVPEDQLLGRATTIGAKADSHAALTTLFSDHADRPDVRMELQRGQTIRGRCIDTAGAPVPGVAVWFENTSVNSGSDGRFVLASIPQTGGTLVIDPDEHVFPRPIELPAGQGESDLGDFVLETGRPVAGQVVDGAGQGIAGAEIAVSHREWGKFVAQVTADEQGHFRAAHIGDGEHSVAASGTTGDWASKVKRVTHGVVAGTTDLRIVLDGGGTLLIHFLDESDRSEVTVASAEVTARRTDTAADRHGQAWAGARIQQIRMTLEEPGIYTVEVKVPGYDPAVVEGIEIFPDRGARIDALLRPRQE